VSPALLEAVRREAAAADGGLRARLERAARTVAVLRGLGYAGAYLGGTHNAEHVQWIIRRAAEIAPRWREFTDELHYGAPGGFYLYADPGTGARRRSASVRRPLMPRLLDFVGRALPVTRDTVWRRALRRVFAGIDRRPALAAGLERAELAIKRPLFGCQACGNCVLSHMEYVCPQTCPKQLRNGPCGGTHLGRCEVVDKPCIWGAVYERAKAADRVAELTRYIPPPDRSLTGTSSWINYFLNRDRRPDTAS
jgi:methylenetetrahydrofolate reductase (NADPH)